MPPGTTLAMQQCPAGQGLPGQIAVPAHDADWRKEYAAIAALGALAAGGDARALVALIAFLGDGRRGERLPAALALNALPSPAARAALWRAAREDPIAGVRLAALRSLGLQEEEVSDARTARPRP